MERDTHGLGSNPLVCHCAIGSIIWGFFFKHVTGKLSLHICRRNSSSSQPGWKYFMFKTLKDLPANKILIQCNMPLSSVYGNFFSQVSFCRHCTLDEERVYKTGFKIIHLMQNIFHHKLQFSFLISMMNTILMMS